MKSKFKGIPFENGRRSITILKRDGICVVIVDDCSAAKDKVMVKLFL
jgi:hypothetical protein